MTFDVPVADAEFSFKPDWSIDTPSSPFIWQWNNNNTVSLTLPTKSAISEIMGDGIGDKVWIYTRSNTRTKNGGIDEYGDWRVDGTDGLDWGTVVSQLITEPMTIDLCNRVSKSVCLGIVSDIYNVMIRVERSNQSYWFAIF